MFLQQSFWKRGALALLTGLVLSGFGLAQQNAGRGAKAQPKVEVVFCLDTTGSMGGLINAARQKIWTICNQVAGGQPTPHLKVGLVAFRDRGDEYVTKVIPLTDDLDAIYSHLMSFKAQGGGDFPEAVNQALHESVTKINWSKDAKTLKIIFLVGDAPPKHYADDVPYQTTCQTAVKNNIIINTIQCGGHAETERVWKDICRRAEGSYVQIDAQGGPVLAVATPFDDELATLNRKLVNTTLTYGDGTFRAEADKKKETAKSLPTDSAAPRAGFAGKSGKTAAYDLIDNLKDGKVQLETLQKEQLPKELQGLNLKEQKQYLERVQKERAQLQKKAVELDQKRNAYIQTKLKEQSQKRAQDSFDNQVLQILQTQARRVNVRYGTDAQPAGKK
jgi:Mg-chelatase subunit ChlD